MQPERGLGGRPVLVAAAVAAVLGAVLLVAPPMGTDLAAQVARAEFVRSYGLTPVDLRWYGGVGQFGYSLVVPALGSVVGVLPVGVLAAVVSAAGFAYLLVRCGANRPLLGGVLGALVAVGNLVSGRTTFAVGLALGTLALCALLVPAARWVRLTATAALAVLATLASPVAGLFVGLAGGALLVSAWWPRGPVRAGWFDGLVLCAAPAAAMVPMAVLGDGGRQPFTGDSMRIVLALTVAAALLVPARYRVVRVGAVLAAALLVATYVVPSPIGYNAARLPMLYAVPVVAALADLDRRWLVAVLAGLVWWQPPVVVGDLVRAGSPESRLAFYRPLVAELDRRGPVGRVEVVPLHDHWEAMYVGSAVPLARGWERQVDVVRNPLFYRPALGVDEYGEWLRRNAVSFVAVAPGQEVDSFARTEAALVASRPTYLREVWRDRSWLLYEVAAPMSIVDNATLVRATADALTFDVAEPGDVLVRVRWSRWLTVAGPGGYVAPGPDDWTLVRDARVGRYTLSSALW
jgi:hypothetical protein